MATDEPDSDAVSEGLRQLRRTRGGSVYAPPSSPEGAGGRRPRPKSSSAPVGTQLGAGQPKFVEESPEAQKVKGTVLCEGGVPASSALPGLPQALAATGLQ